MLCRGIEIGGAHDLLGKFHVNIRFTCNDLQTFLEVHVCIRRHEGVLAAVGAVVINTATPRVQIALSADCLAGTGLDALTALVAQAGGAKLAGFQFCIRQNKAVPDKGAIFGGQQRADHALFAQSALYSTVEEINLIFCLHAPHHIGIVHFRVGAVFLVHNKLVFPLRNGLKAFFFNEIAHIDQGQGHNSLFQVFHAHGGVLVVGRTLFHTSVNATQYPESQTDDGFGLGEDAEHRIVRGKAAGRRKSHQVGIIFFSQFYDLVSHILPTSFKCL